MKHHIKIFVVMCALVVCKMVSPAHSEYLFSTGVRYDIFSADYTPETNGFEFTIPLGVAYKQKHYSISMETAYSSATVDPGDESDASFSSLTDTLLSVTYIYSFPDRPMGITAGLDVNLPTGKERLRDRERIAEAGGNNDLFEVDNFGDGLNVGLSLGLIREIGNVSLGIQGAYIFNGEFDSTRDIPDDDLDPGDQIMALALFGWQVSSRLTLDAFIAYSHFFVDKVNGQKIFLEGENVVIGGNLRYEREPVGVTISLQGTPQLKNEEIFEEKLPAELEISNRNKFLGLLDLTYRPSLKLTLCLLGDVRYSSESDLKFEIERIRYTIGLPVEGKRIRYAIGPGVIYALNEHISCDGSLKFFIMHQDPDIMLEQEVTFQGINLNVGFTYIF